MKYRPRPVWLAVLLNTFVTLVSVAVGYLYVTHLAEQRLRLEVEKVRQIFSQKLSSAETVASALQSMAHAASPNEVSEASLQKFAESTMEKNSSIRSVLYYHRVSDSSRASFEEQLAAHGVSDGIVDTSRSDINSIVRAESAKEYFVLMTGDRAAIENLFVGWNMLSDAVRAKALGHSLGSGRPTATDAYLLSDGNSAIEVLVPVYKKGAVESGGADSTALVGAIGVVIDLTSMLGKVELRKNFTTILKTRFSSEDMPRSVYRSLSDSRDGMLRLGQFQAEERFTLFSYEIILGFEKDIFLSSLNYGILIAVGLACVLIFVLGHYLANYMEQVATLNQDLERKVIDRTRELDRSKNEIQEILDNLDDAIFVIDDQQRIQARHSPSASRMLGVENLSGLTLRELLLKDLDPKEERVSRHDFTLGMLFHSDSFQWDISVSNLMKTISYNYPGKDGPTARRSFSVRYAPLYENDSVERVLVIVSDLTELLALRQDGEVAREQSSQRLQVVSEMLAAERSGLVSFFEELQGRVDLLRKLADELESGRESSTMLPLLFREIHTLKGNSRMLKFARLAREAHDFEDGQASLIQTAMIESRESREQLVTSLRMILKSALQYQEIYEEIFSGQNSKREVLDLWEEVVTLSKWLDAPPVLQSLARAKKMDEVFRLQTLWLDYQAMVNEIAERLGKKVQPLQIVGDAWLDRELQGPLRDVFTHLLRNALDHGIEIPELRGAKPFEAAIMLVVTISENGQLELLVRDDGKGIDPDTIFSIAKNKGIVPAEQSQPAPDIVYELLFASGFSTKSEVSDISGRGVGLDAVRSTMRERGGDVWIESEKGKGTCFHLALPSRMVLVAHNSERLLSVPMKPSLEKAS